MGDAWGRSRGGNTHFYYMKIDKRTSLKTAGRPYRLLKGSRVEPIDFLRYKSKVVYFHKCKQPTKLQEKLIEDVQKMSIYYHFLQSGSYDV